MQLFYVPDIKGTSCILDGNESRHIIKVIRMQKGDSLMLVDGYGGLYEGIVTVPDPKACQISITRVTRDFEKRDYRLHIAISPIKNQERFEWFVEKSVEIGVDEITPVICRNTEKTGLRKERLNNIIISAMKQSVKAFRPILNDPVTFSEFVNFDHNGIKIIAHCNSGLKRNKFDQVYEKNKDAFILIGPEGDFSKEEVRQASDRGFISVNLGNSRLRTETAGIVACHSVYFINQNP